MFEPFLVALGVKATDFGVDFNAFGVDSWKPRAIPSGDLVPTHETFELREGKIEISVAPRLASLAVVGDSLDVVLDNDD